MAFWYDIKNKKYASNGSNGWLRSYIDKAIAMLKAGTDGKFAAHYAGTDGRHKAEAIDCSDGNSVEQSIQKEVAARLSGDSQIHQQLQEMEKSLEELDNVAGRKTQNGGEIFGNGAANQAISEFATASGTDNFAGMKGFKVLSKSGTEAAVGTYTLDSVEGLEVGDIYSVRFDWDFIDRGEITEIDAKTKTVTATNFASRALDEKDKNDPWENTFFVLAKPDVGTVDRGLAAHTTGIQNKNYGTGSFVTGLKNIAAGLGSFVSGKSNKAGCCASSGGYGNNAKGTFSMAFGAENIAEKDCDIALGSQVKARGQYSFATNNKTETTGVASSAFGTGTIATTENSAVFGRYNSPYDPSKAIVVGNGTNNENRSNAYTLDWDGNATFAGNITTKKGAVVTQSGINAVAIGTNTEASGRESFACGTGTRATQNQAFAQGFGTTAGAHRAHAEGVNTEVWGDGGHAEGNGTMVHEGHEYAHVEGIGTQSTGKASHAEGKYNTGGNFAHVVGNGTDKDNRSNAYTLDWQGNAVFAGDVKVQGDKTVATGESVEALNVRGLEGENEEIEPGVYAVAEKGATIIGNTEKRNYTNIGFPKSNSATGLYAVALGEASAAMGRGSIAMGRSYSKGSRSIAAGEDCVAEGSSSVAMGIRSNAYGHYSVALGYECEASDGSAALGEVAIAEGNVSVAMGSYVKSGSHQTSVGHYNLCGEAGDRKGTRGSAFTIGNGTPDAESNAFRVLYDGTCYAAKTFEANSADIAEAYEWIDGNPDKEDRRGLFVTLDGTKIRLATPEDEYIKGVVSARPCLAGDAYNEMWHNKYLTDVFGVPLTQTVHYEAEYEEIEEIDEETGETRIERVLVREEYDAEELVINPDYDSSLEYMPRSKRPEYDFVSSWGKLVLVDDGTCEVNGFATVGEGGKATKAEVQTMYRVMERKDENHIYVAIG